MAMSLTRGSSSVAVSVSSVVGSELEFHSSGIWVHSRLESEGEGSGGGGEGEGSGGWR